MWKQQPKVHPKRVLRPISSLRQILRYSFTAVNSVSSNFPRLDLVRKPSFWSGLCTDSIVSLKRLDLEPKPTFLKWATILLVLFAGLTFTGCQEDTYAPKPRSFYRIDMPVKEYQTFAADYCPCEFEYPTYADVEQKTKFFNDLPDHPCWLNMELPYFNATIHLSYMEIDSEEKLERVINDAYKYAFKHSIKADFIDQLAYNQEDVHGMLFDIGGNVASSVQFYATDSASHYLRGSLYFNESPKADSLRPVIQFIREDMLQILQTIQWE